MDGQIVVTIALMALVTYLPRMVPIVLLSGREFPPVIMKWLGLLPPALLGALVAQAVLMPEGALNLSWDNPVLIPALIAGVVAWRRGSLALIVLSGMAAVGVMHYILHG